MARLLRKKHWFWLVPALLLLVLAVTVLGGLTYLRVQGWHWQGLGWRQGPVLAQLVWRQDDCTRLRVRDVHVAGLWPLQLTAQRVAVPACPVAAASTGGFALPPAPPFSVRIQALQWRDYPPVQVAIHHQGPRWWGQAQRAGSQLQASYTTSDQRWQLSGTVAAADWRDYWRADLAGTLAIAGQGHWRPRAAANKSFTGQLHIDGQQLGLQQHSGQQDDKQPAELRADLTATLAWQGPEWSLQAALAQPLAMADGWIVMPGPGVQAAGVGLRLSQADAQLAIQGDKAHATLTLRSDAKRLGSGQGRIELSHGLTGSVAFGWADGAVTVQPFTVTGATLQGVTLALRQAVTLPLAMQGEIAPTVVASHDTVQVQTTRSNLRWDGSAVRWQGALQLAGHWQGYALSGGWAGSIDRVGLHGEPLQLTLTGVDGHMQALLPVTGLWPTQWPLTTQLQGEFRGRNIAASITAAPQAAGWGGQLQAQTQLTQADQGGQLRLSGDWLWQDGLTLAAGAQLTLAQTIKGEVLVKPVTLTTTTSLTLGAAGASGKLRLQAGGVTAARWQLPPLQADISLTGDTMTATARVPTWDATLQLQGRDLLAAPGGTFGAHLPLQPGISRGLAVSIDAGTLAASGSWRWADNPTVSARLQAHDVKLDWGSIAASGVQADVAVDWHPGAVRIDSRAPLRVAKLTSGIELADIRFGLDSNLDIWRLQAVSAQVLGGRLSAAALTWPSAVYQPVVLSNIDVSQIVALQSKPVVTATGQVGGTMPLRLLRSSLAIRDGNLHNETPLHLTIPDSDSVRALKQTNQAVKLALDVISTLRIDDFSAHIDMDAKGLLQAAMTIQGVNPQQGQPIVLNYTHQENMFDLLRNLRISGRVVDAVVGDHEVVPAPAAP